MTGGGRWRCRRTTRSITSRAGRPHEPFEQIRIVAQRAADAAWFAHRKIERHRSDARLGMLHRQVALKYRRPTVEQLAEAKAVLAVERLPRLAQYDARNVV